MHKIKCQETETHCYQTDRREERCWGRFTPEGEDEKDRQVPKAAGRSVTQAWKLPTSDLKPGGVTHNCNPVLTRQN